MSTHNVKAHRRGGATVRAHTRAAVGPPPVDASAADAARAAARDGAEDHDDLAVEEETAAPDGLMVVLTEATCGEACWAAQHDVCRCSCGGANHGIKKRGGSADRTRKVGRNRYRLIAVMTESDRPYAAARELARERQPDDFRSHHNFALRPSWGPPNVIAVEPATKVQERWPELEDHATWRERQPGGSRTDRRYEAQTASDLGADGIAISHMSVLVPETGVEPVRPLGHRVLNPVRLPFRHSGKSV